MNRIRPWLYAIAPLLLLLAGLIAHLRFPGVVQSVRLQVFDAYQRVRPREYEPVPVKIVDVDDESLERLGQWPWPRTRVAALLDRLQAGGAMVVALDFIFAEPDRTSPENVLPLWVESDRLREIRELAGVLPRHDAVFAEAIDRLPTVSGFVLTNEAGTGVPRRPYTMTVTGPSPVQFLPGFHGAIVNLPEIDQAVAGSGSFNLVPDRDGMNRRIHMLFQSGGLIYPSLVAEVLRVMQDAVSYDVRVSGADDESWYGREAGIRELKIGRFVVPTDGRGRLWMHSTRYTRERYLPAWRLLDPAFDPATLAGYVVLVGTSAAGLKDLRATPLNPVTAGVEVHAALIEQVLLGHFLVRPGWAEFAEIFYLVALALVLIALLPRLHAVGCAMVGGLTVAGAAGASWYAYVEHRWLVDPVLPSLAVLVVYLVSTALRFAHTEAERRQVRDAFGHYLAPAVVQQLVDNPGLLRLGGEKRETTFLFTDIAGFTGLTEGLDPGQLVLLLNDYLDATCRIVLDHGGTIDKIVGDALHVMFNAPSDQPDHADRAVRCALALDEFCAEFSERQRAMGLALGETRIGVNTGTTVVGNFGGASRFDYTAHGDAINTAARLESVNKHLGTRICISGTTRALSRHPTYRPVGRLVLKGKSEGLECFEPLREDEAQSERIGAYLEAYAMLEREEPCAAETFRGLRERYPQDKLFAFHAARLDAGEHGAVIVMDEK